MAEQILIRGDTLANWNRANPILGTREIALVYDGLVINAKAGNGYSHFKELEYVWYDILVNGVRIRPTDIGSFDIFVPVKTSEIDNDGDGTSPFTTQAVLDAAVTSLQSSLNALDSFFKGELTGYPKKYVKTFNAASDWSGSSPYTISIPVSTHGAGVTVLNTPYTARHDRGTYADILLELNTMLSGMIGYNANGQLQIDPSQDDISDLDKPVLWNFRLDESVFSGATYSLGTSAVYNDIIVTGAVIDGVRVRGRATNRNIRSPFNVQTIGLKTMPPSETESDRFVTNGQCDDWAKWLLKYNTVMKSSVTIKCSQIFHLYENALVTLYRPDRKNALERHLINGYTLPIGNGQMTINATSVSDLPEF